MLPTRLARIRLATLLVAVGFTLAAFFPAPADEPAGASPVLTLQETEPPGGDTAEESEAPPFIGIIMGEPAGGGIPIDRIIPGTAAERFGLEVGDVILHIDGTATGSPGLLQSAVSSKQPGDMVDLEVLRGDEHRIIRLELGARPDDLELRREEAEQVLEVLGVRPGQNVADIGCGTGWLSQAIAQALDGSGTVYAVELQEHHIKSLRRRAVPGIVPVLSQPGDVTLPEDSVDIAMLHDVASHIQHDARASFYASVQRALRDGGRLVVFGPHGEAKTMLDVLREHGFEPVEGSDLDRLSEDDLDRRLAEGIVFSPA